MQYAKAFLLRLYADRSMRCLYALVLSFLLCCPHEAMAVDEDNCLFCHGYRGLSYINKSGDFKLLHVTGDTYINSPHGNLKCTDCHTEIKKFPHQDPVPVNCLTVCHLDEPSSGLPFSHKKIGEYLDRSVHGKLDKDGFPKKHPEDYPDCVTCHLDPLYRPLNFIKHDMPGLKDKTVSRCAACHEEKDFMNKFYNHFTSRMQKQRKPLEVVEMCSRCHGDTEMMARHDLPNLMKTYLETYHGKAVHFGDERSADCNDCHVLPGESIHSILSMDDPDSASYRNNIYKTCSDIDCHSEADLNLTGYKAHVLLDPKKNPVEFYVCVFFVLLTLGSFIPLMIFSVFDMARNVFPNAGLLKDRQGKKDAALLMEDAFQGSHVKINVVEKDGKFFFERLTLNERIQHVFLFVSFTLLAVTGLPLKFHHTDWGSWLYSMVGGITYAPLIHRISAVVMTVTFFYHVGYAICCTWKNYLKPLKDSGTLNFRSGLYAMLELPMMPGLTDLKELGATLKYFLFISNNPPSLVAHGLKEKFGYFAVFWGVPVIGISGFFLWGESFFTRYFSGHVLNFAYIAHSDEAFLASIVIFIWHLYNVHFAPAVFPMGRAWLDGYMGEREIIQYHYYDYLRAMKGAGLEDKIRGQQTSRELQVGFFKRCFEKCYMVIMIIAICYTTVIISRVIYESVFVFGYQIVTTEPAIAEPLVEPKFIEEIRLESDNKTKLYRGYRFVREKQIKDHYHRIELEIGQEKTSHCITCHGDLPHGKSTHIRSFLNMHNIYFACQTCHVRPQSEEKRLYYYWYDREKGNPVFNPEIGNKPIDALKIKLSPCEDCDEKPGHANIRAAREKTELLMGTLQNPETPTEKKKNIVKQIHASVSEKPLGCGECHSRKNPFLPLEEMGYPKYRAEQVASDQITKLIKEYKEFHTPAFLEPGKYRKNNGKNSKK